ncbi:unnamed protein product [Coregonus sp. 'balchen']|nr:unnamed protein product [Coregonus sp. 'balchen']
MGDHDGALLWVLVTAGATVKQVTLGGTINLECDIKVKYDIIWFVLHPNTTLSLAAFTFVKQDKSLRSTAHFGGRFVPVYNKAVPTVDLTIWNLTDSDLGLYYCGMWIDDVFEIGNGTQLTFTDQGSTVVGVDLPWFVTLIFTPIISVFGSSLCIRYML